MTSVWNSGSFKDVSVLFKCCKIPPNQTSRKEAQVKGQNHVMTASNKTEITLKNFFVFNSSFGQNEGQEEEKIMYFFPKETNVEIKMKEVGLSEAIIKFTETFSTELCNAVHTKKTRKIFLQPEPEFWMIMTVAVPTGWDALEGVEYRGCEVQVPIYEAVVRQAYLAAKLFIGPFQNALTSHGSEIFKTKLDAFYTRHGLLFPNCGGDISMVEEKPKVMKTGKNQPIEN